MIVSIGNLAEHGIVRDRPAQELPPNAFTDGRNVRTRDGAIERFLGHSELFGTLPTTPYWLMTAVTPNLTSYFWIFAGLTKVYAHDGTSSYNITRQTSGNDVDYAATADLNWTGGVIKGIPVLSNGVDPPQMWNPVSPSQRLTPLTYTTGVSTWASLGYSCRALRVFKDYLVAMDVTKGSDRNPHMVKWSHPATQGVPLYWDETDPTKDAGEYSLSQSPGAVLDCATLRDVNIIYKEDSVWLMQHVGGPFVFRFARMFDTFGALSRRCAVEYKSGRHAVFALGDLISHDGQNWESIIEGRMRRWLFQRIDATYYRRCFCARHPQLPEVWFCYVPHGSTLPTEAIVWNYLTNSLGVREFEGIAHLDSGNTTWTGMPGNWSSLGITWDSTQFVWDAPLFTRSQMRLVGASAANGKILLMESTNSFAGSPFESYIERTSLGVPFGSQPPDISTMKFCRRIWPRIEGTIGSTVYISVGSQNSPLESPVWNPEVPFIIGTTKKVDSRVRGRLLAFRLRSSASLHWRLIGYDLDIDEAGGF